MPLQERTLSANKLPPGYSRMPALLRQSTRLQERLAGANKKYVKRESTAVGAQACANKFIDDISIGAGAPCRRE
jgi:hypothetical protein